MQVTLLRLGRAARLLWSDGLGRVDAASLRGDRMKRDLIVFS